MRTLAGAPWCSLAAVFWLCASCSEPEASGPPESEPRAAPGTPDPAPLTSEAPASDAPLEVQRTVDARSAATPSSVEFEQLTIRVQLVDPDGLAAKPLRTWPRLIELVGNRVHVSAARAYVDEHGNATVSCSPRIAGARQRLLEVSVIAAVRFPERRAGPRALLRLPTPAISAVLELGAVQLHDPYDDRALRRLSDDELEREHALVVQLDDAEVLGAFALSTVELEMARRGGKRWVAILRSAFEMKRELEERWRRAPDESASDDDPGDIDSVCASTVWDPLGLLARLTLLRRAERRPDPAQLLLRGSSPREFVAGTPMSLAIGLINVDSSESFYPPPRLGEYLRVTVLDENGIAIQPREREARMLEGPQAFPYLAPGEASWTTINHPRRVDISSQVDLPPGRYTVVLEAPIEAHANEVGSLHGRVTIKSEPFEIVVRARD